MTLIKALEKLVNENKHSSSNLDFSNTLIQQLSLQDKDYLESWFTNVKVFNLQNTDLKSLQNFPHLPNLKCLILTNNNLTDRDIEYIRSLPELSVIHLDHNNIRDLHAIS